CAMFQEENFPAYPFENSGMTTLFGKNGHTRVKVHPAGNLLYTFGGTDNTINVYDLKQQELVDVLEMPSAEGAEVVAITFSPNGELLYAVANLRGIDSVFGVARIKDEHSWEQMTILCDLEIVEMDASQKNDGLIYAIGLGKGLFFLHPKVFMDETKPRPQPAYQFSAVGHMAIDELAGLAYCTDDSQAATRPESYNQIAVCNLDVSVGDGTSTSLQPDILRLKNANGLILSGTDGLAVRQSNIGGSVTVNKKSGRLYIVATNTIATENKRLLTYNLPLNDLDKTVPNNTLEIEKTQVSLAYHKQSDHLILAMEDGYRLQMVDPNGNASKFYRIPVQIQPVDVVVNKDNGQVYTLNFMSNTLSVIPAQELPVNSAFLDTLAAYRTDVLLAFYGLFGNVLQYIKDCFCDHLLVKCPDCNGDELIYLANIEIRENKVYKICNFEKRKYVKSFPTIDYWLSLVPVMPLIEKAVSKFCCWILPSFFDRKKNDWIKAPKSGGGQMQGIQNRFTAKTSRENAQTYVRTDIKAIARNQITGVKLGGRLAGDSLTNLAETGRHKNIGVKKQALMNNTVNNATTELQRNQIEVVDVKTYDAKKASQYISEYTQTPQRIEPGSKVTLIKNDDDMVVFYSVEQPKATTNIEISDEVRLELDQFEKRKADLSDFSILEAELARTETRRASVVELSAIKDEFRVLQTEKSTIEEELAGLKSQVDSVKTQRIAEENKLAEMSSLRNTISRDLTEMNESLLAMQKAQETIKLDIIKNSPVTSLSGVTKDMDSKLRAAGIMTIEDLTKTNATVLSRNTTIDKNTLTKIITSAKNRLKKLSLLEG
ncbi:MAG: hypothetical protein OEX11_08730, partial [Nitrosomonas sp.]|nr:hypothetical protein [Nitrosomonas sp.]